MLWEGISDTITTALVVQIHLSTCILEIKRHHLQDKMVILNSCVIHSFQQTFFIKASRQINTPIALCDILHRLWVM